MLSAKGSQMLYPPCSSVFYELNPNPDSIDLKIKNQINPRLSETEIQAIFDSFDIINPHQKICLVTGETKTYQDVLLSALKYANQLPTARLWLRQIPAGITFDIFEEKDENTNGYSSNDMICLSSRQVCLPSDFVAMTLVHELAHTIDRSSFIGLNIFPYNPVNDGENWCYLLSETLTEAEAMQLMLLEEAEKNALSKQLTFEAQSVNLSPNYAKRVSYHFNRFNKMFSQWMPSDEAGHWTQKEIDTERLARAWHYTSLASMTDYMKEFLQPYDKLLLKMPEKSRQQIKMVPMGVVFDFSQLKSLNLTYGELEKTFDVIDRVGINLRYRQRAQLLLIEYLRHLYCQKHHLDEYRLSVRQDYILRTKTLVQTSERQKLAPNKPSDYFRQYIERLEDRYMGFIRTRDMKPRNDLYLTYLYINQSQPSKSLIDIACSYETVSALLSYFDQGVDKYLIPYYEQRATMRSCSANRLNTDRVHD